MSTLYYDFNLKDPEIKKQFENESFSFDEKAYRSILVKQSDGDVTIDISDLGTVVALYINSSGAITAKVNGQDIAVNDFMFMTLTALTSLAVACADTTGYQVDVVVWGT